MQNQVQKSENSGMQLNKPKVVSLSEYSTTEEQKEIAGVITDVRLSEINKGNAQSLITAVGKWAFYFGAKVDADDLLALCGFLRENFPNLTISEIQLVPKLYVRGSLTKTDYYGLNPIFMSSVLNTYLAYKRETMREVIQRYEREQEKAEVKPMSDEEYHQTICEAIRTEYAKYHKTGSVDDLFGLIYQYLTETEDIDEFILKTEQAQEYARSRELREQTRKANNLGDLIKKAYTSNERYLKNYAVVDFFKRTADIEKFIKELPIVKSDN
jgi:hypothetical protein